MLVHMLARPSLSRDLGNERKKAKESRSGTERKKAEAAQKARIMAKHGTNTNGRAWLVPESEC